MGKTFTFELPDEIYEVLEQEAEQSGRPVEDVILEWFAQYRSRPPRLLSDEERANAWSSLESHAGAVASGDPHSGDNDRIDRDLACQDGVHEDAR